ncbi:peptidase inhibitor family I36 protein [Nonomuraea sp. NPDC052129]|uniref:peptidase inhibitor family I36 protein n=1 Tax=Nonomuraea sp. NPDC052129 TaxID=3154651 RepID=UPI003425ADF8
MKRKTTLAISALLLSVTSLIGSNAPAHASSAAPDCASFCIYEHDKFNFWGGRWVMFFPDGSCRTVHSSRDNMASSMINGTNRRVKLYDRKNCAGAVGYTAKPHSKDKDFTNNGFDNKLSSIR